ncbi:Probable polygalacturonase [Linum perenne]
MASHLTICQSNVILMQMVHALVAILLVSGLVSHAAAGTARAASGPAAAGGAAASGGAGPAPVPYPALNCRKHTAVITDFGAVGDGKTMNTKAFRDAIAKLSTLATDGGAQLIVPPGKWLTGSFNITSHFTLFLHKDAVILGSQQNKEDYPVIPFLPSYGPGFDNSVGGRYISLIFGENLTDVVITGNNGTIDGQGQPWWDEFKAKKTEHSRPFLLEIMGCDGLQITNLTFINSPMWQIHPIFCNNVLIQGLTVLAPVTVPNTDGINPDSCTNIRIEDSYIVSGDDCIAVKSGIDQYGIKVAKPTKQLAIRRVTCISPDSALVALGSEMSGGIEDVRIEDLTAINTQAAIRVKTAIGRGGYIRNIFVRRITMQGMDKTFWMSGNYKSHADDKWDPKALPEIRDINIRDVVGQNVNVSGKLDGIQTAPFTGLCISNVTLNLGPDAKKLQWNCTDVSGFTSRVTPKPCAELPDKPGLDCPFPEDKLPIDSVVLQSCSTGNGNRGAPTRPEL